MSMHMNTAIGTKLIHFAPMTRLEYNDYRGWSVPEDENPEDEGYLVEYMNGGPANHPDHEGYISWSPQEVFDQAYRAIDNLPFSMAMEALQTGMVVCRAGWNGKGMFLYKVPAGKYQAQHPAARATFGNDVPYGPYIALKTAQDNVMPWQPSNGDMLANDWEIVSNLS